VLPQIEKASVSEIVRRVVDAHERRTGTKAEVVIDDDGRELTDAVKICIYRFVQEALNNAYRHGGGIGQKVSARSHDGAVRMEVSDRGDGFDPNDIRPTSLGLIGMRERVDSLGGDFEVRSGDDGTIVTMAFEAMEAGEN
jgi:signal transduction histidine kinase